MWGGGEGDVGGVGGCNVCCLNLCFELVQSSKGTQDS